MSWVLVIVIAVILYFVINGQSKSDEEYDDDSSTTANKDLDKQSSLSKEATKLKKDGNLEDAVKKIDEAISIEPSNTLVYKKSYYLQLNNQFDEAWKVMSLYNEDANVRLLESTDFHSFKVAFWEYSGSSISLIKLLKKEKRIKEVIYYLPGSEYNDLLAKLINQNGTIKEIISQIKKTDISKNIKLKKSDNIDLSKFDSKYREVVLSYKDDFESLYKICSKDYYANVPSGFSKEAIDAFEIASEEHHRSIKQDEREAFKILKNLWSKGITLNDDCYKALGIKYENKKLQRQEEVPQVSLDKKRDFGNDFIGKAAELKNEALNAVKTKEYNKAWQLFHQQKDCLMRHANEQRFNAQETSALDASVSENLANILRIEKKHTDALIHIIYWISTSSRRTKAQDKKLDAYFNRAKLEKLKLSQLEDFIAKNSGFRNIRNQVQEWSNNSN